MRCEVHESNSHGDAVGYMAQVVIGHVIFIASNLGVESQRIHVKIASIESPVVLLIALCIW
jgi:hypothetical protein